MLVILDPSARAGVDEKAHVFELGIAEAPRALEALAGSMRSGETQLPEPGSIQAGTSGSPAPIRWRPREKTSEGTRTHPRPSAVVWIPRP